MKLLRVSFCVHDFLNQSHNFVCFRAEDFRVHFLYFLNRGPSLDRMPLVNKI
jgi:hypothetical protein